jgi:hypothetical protein
LEAQLEEKEILQLKNTPKTRTNWGGQGFFFFQLCDVPVLVIIHKRN